MAGRKSILILGGTGEARRLASALVATGHQVTSSLAGRTRTPLLPVGEVRIGGFGGAAGLADHLRKGGFTHLIDATHPFAAQISANAVKASEATGIPLLRLERPAWIAPKGGDWIEADTMDDAASALPHSASVLLTIGRQEVAAFFRRSDCRFVARVIEAPGDVPEDWLVLSARGPFSVADEEALMRQHGSTHLVSKNSGSDQAAAKLEAAAALGVSVVMIGRPVLPDAPTVGSIEAVIAAL